MHGAQTTPSTFYMCLKGDHELYKHLAFAPPLHQVGVQPACCAVYAALSLQTSSKHA